MSTADGRHEATSVAWKNQLRMASLSVAASLIPEFTAFGSILQYDLTILLFIPHEINQMTIAHPKVSQAIDRRARNLSLKKWNAAC
ncbi:hypothetical protein [Mycobacteroides abscessus]|uniref:hypothetical protein n=1 Tax=Mycobacteroides abscessus TaxID=36809 RepID=UPI001056E952|nr:hypothetical protein [Mycobacteroides abscessus]